MAKGENIFKRKDGRWEARYIKGYELSGKIKYGFCYGKTYREAKEKVTKCKAALVNGKPIPSTNSRHRFAFYCDEWLRMRKPKVKESTYIKYDTALRKHIKPKLGGCFPMGMTTGLIDDFTEELLFEDELAPKTVHDVLVVLHGILKYTATFFTGGFPAIEINYPKPGKKEMRVLSREEQTRFVSYLLDDMDTCKFGVLLTLFTGVRIGELCALQWGNISLKEQTIRIRTDYQPCAGDRCRASRHAGAFYRSGRYKRRAYGRGRNPDSHAGGNGNANTHGGAQADGEPRALRNREAFRDGKACGNGEACRD